MIDLLIDVKAQGMTFRSCSHLCPMGPGNGIQGGSLGIRCLYRLSEFGIRCLYHLSLELGTFTV